MEQGNQFEVFGKAEEEPDWVLKILKEIYGEDVKSRTQIFE